MAAKIMESGDTESSIFAPRGSFMVTVRAVTGAIAGDWFLYYSDDKDRTAADWQQAHDDAFSDTYFNDIFDMGVGFYFQLRGGTGTNIEAHFAHIANVAEGKYGDENSIIE